MDVTCHLDKADLQDYISRVFGSSYFVARVSRMHGGAQRWSTRLSAVMDFPAFCMCGIFL